MGLFDKLSAGYKVLRQGEELANAEKWKSHQITGGMVALFLGAIVTALNAFGLDFHMSEGDLAYVGGAVVALYGAINAYLTAATSSRAGLKADDDANAPADRVRRSGGV